MFNNDTSGSGFNVLSIAAPVIAAKRQEEYRNLLANMGAGRGPGNGAMTHGPGGAFGDTYSSRTNALANYGGPTNAAAEAMGGERDLLAKTLMAEAGGEGPMGMLAAGSVIANRAGSGNYGNGIEGVIMRPGQFSAWNGVTGYAGGEGGLDMANMTPSEDAYRVADMILSGNYRDPTGGATHYYNPAAANPAWGASAGGDWSRIGNHLFGSADAGRGASGPTDALSYLGI